MKLYIVAAPALRSDTPRALSAANIAAIVAREFPEIDVSCKESFYDEAPEDFANRIGDGTHVGFSLYTWSDKYLYAVAAILKARNPDVVLFAGGPEVALHPGTILTRAPFDTVVVGDGEQATVELVRLWLAGKSAEPIIYAPVQDLSNLPSPWLTGFAEPSQITLWELSRGCPFNCSYCYEHMVGTAQTVRYFNIDRIKEELKLFVKSGVKGLALLDSTFNISKQRANELLDYFYEIAPHIEFQLEARPELLDEDFINHLKRLNSPTVRCGVQSIHTSVLKAIHRPELDRSRLRQIFTLFYESNIRAGMDLICGLPNDTLDGFRESINYAISLRPRLIETFTLMILPGTEIDQRRDEWGIVASETPPYFVRSTSTMTEEDVKQATRLSQACNLLYTYGCSQRNFLPIIGPLGMKPSEVFEEFADWYGMKAEHRQTLTDIIPKDIRSIQLAFYHYIYKKKNMLFSEGLY